MYAFAKSPLLFAAKLAKSPLVLCPKLAKSPLLIFVKNKTKLFVYPDEYADWDK